jgi:mannan endo-1,4-beta-mannosidase
MWKKNLDDKRIIALDDMPGWDKITVSTPSQKRANKIKNNINMAVIGKNLTISTSYNGNATITLFDMTGHRVTTLLQGNITAGTYRLDMQSIAAGNYIVKASVNNHNSMQVLRLK